MKKLVIQNSRFIWSIWENNITCFKSKEAEILCKICKKHNIKCNIKWNDDQTVQFDDCRFKTEIDDEFKLNLSIIYK